MNEPTVTEKHQDFIDYHNHCYSRNYEDNHLPLEGYLYQYSDIEDDHWSILFSSEIPSIKQQIANGKKLDSSIALRLTDDPEDIDLIEFAIQHRALDLQHSHFNDLEFMLGIHLQKNDFQNEKAAEVLLRLCFAAGMTPDDMLEEMCEVWWYDDDEEMEICEKWLKKVYKKTTKEPKK
ncbi:hypothetical protein AWB71_05335 [Caballeronia peredens]|nr:hypothetical protein AWB71_05335 [Caballeronia peredens]